MASRFDSIAEADVAFFLDEFGVSATYVPGNGDPQYSISLVPDDAKPLLVRGSSAETTFYETRVTISARSNTEGRVAPAVLGQGVADRIEDYLTSYSSAWYVAHVEENADTGMHELVLRSKQFPYQYENDVI